MTVSDAEWGRILPWITALLDESGNTQTPDDIKREIDADRIELVLFPHFAVLLSIVEYPQKRALRVVGMGGDLGKCMGDFQAYMMGLPELAKQLGCNRLEATGRLGWVRAIKEIGMTSHAFMWKDI
jgi:hypothetical protein